MFNLKFPFKIMFFQPNSIYLGGAPAPPQPPVHAPAQPAAAPAPVEPAAAPTVNVLQMDFEKLNDFFNRNAKNK